MTCRRSRCGPEIADVVLALHFLYHVEDIPATVAELARVVRPDGVVIVATNGPDHHYRVPELIGAASGCDELRRPGTRFDLGNAPGFLGVGSSRRWRPTWSPRASS